MYISPQCGISVGRQAPWLSQASFWASCGIYGTHSSDLYSMCWRFPQTEWPVAATGVGGIRPIPFDETLSWTISMNRCHTAAPLCLANLEDATDTMISVSQSAHSCRMTESVGLLLATATVIKRFERSNPLLLLFTYATGEDSILMFWACLPPDRRLGNSISRIVDWKLRVIGYLVIVYILIASVMILFQYLCTKV